VCEGLVEGVGGGGGGTVLWVVGGCLVLIMIQFIRGVPCQ